jgi:hypothetical protein
LYLSFAAQFHFLNDLLILELGSLAVFAEVNLFFMPDILAQKLFLRFAALDPAFNFDGLVVTAVFNLEPGLAASVRCNAFFI